MRRSAHIAALFALTTLAGCGETASTGQQPEPRSSPAQETGRANHFAVEPFARGLNRPTWVGTAPGDTAVWVLEQPGRVLRLDAERRTVALDMTDGVALGVEQGLLGLAFHPDFAANRLLYLHWSDLRGDTRVAEFRAGADGTIAPRATRELLHVDQPEENHNGGQLAFGPDGRLYLGLGDGGGAFDPQHNAQNPESLLGKILATTVDGEPDWQVVLSGLRNPWRFSFDPALGELWIGDVGQDEAEEVNRVLLEPDEPPKNLGWNIYEGVGRTPSTHGVVGEGEVVWPAATYSHRKGCSITGGVVYHGTALRELDRRYVYGDYCTGVVWSLLAKPGTGAADVRRERAKVPQLAHIGTDADGELLFASGAGTLYRAVPAGSAG
ncbi:MAG: PQQ-dependent sugar dehydrogenase [Solirubrobacteraceae bacterium]